MSDDLREAVRAELLSFAKHMRATAIDGVSVDQWIRDGLDWYIKQVKDKDE